MKIVLIALLSVFITNFDVIYCMHKDLSSNEFYKSIESKRFKMSSLLDQWSKSFNRGSIIMARFKPLLKALIAVVSHSASLSVEQKEHAIHIIQESIENNFSVDEQIYQQYNDQNCKRILLNIVANLMNNELFDHSDAIAFSNQIKEQARESAQGFENDEDILLNLGDLLKSNYETFVENNFTDDTSEMRTLYEYLKEIINLRYEIEYHVNSARRSRLSIEPAAVEQRCLPD